MASDPKKTVSLQFLLCLCSGCIRGEDDSTEYYTLLGIEPNADPTDIRKAWRKLSLRLHPDKLAQRGKVATVEDQESFTRTKDAYLVLSDPDRRAIYDRYGANGVKWTEDPSSIDPNDVLQNFTRSSTGDRLRIVAIFGVILCMVLLFPIMLCAKLDGSAIPWLGVCLPLWFLELLWLLLQFTGLRALRKANVRKKDSSDNDVSAVSPLSSSSGAVPTPSSTNSSSSSSSAPSPSPLPPASHAPPAGSSCPPHSPSDADESTSFAINDDEIELEDPGDGDFMRNEGRAVAESIALAGLVYTSLTLSWQLLLALKLQNPDSTGYSVDVALLPLLAAEILMVRHNRHLIRRIGDVLGGEKIGEYIIEDGTSGDNEKEARHQMFASIEKDARRSVTRHVCIACAVLLVLLKLGLGLSSSFGWGLAALPLWLLFASDICTDCGDIAKGANENNSAVESSSASNNNETGQERQSEHERALQSFKVCSAACHACFVVCVLLVISILAVEKASGAAFSACWIFFPLFLIGGCSFICFTCFVCCAVDHERAPYHYTAADGFSGPVANADTGSQHHRHWSSRDTRVGDENAGTPMPSTGFVRTTSLDDGPVYSPVSASTVDEDTRVHSATDLHAVLQPALEAMNHELD